jgi:cell division initiation protein
MMFSPLTIKQQEFNSSFRGYDKEEVQAFLARLADEFESLQAANEKLKTEIEELQPQLAEYKRIEKNLQDTLLKAQETSSKSIETSKKQTSLMIKEAEIKAAQIVEKARENANEIRTSVITLREERDLIISRLKAIINTQSVLLQAKIEEQEIPKVEEKKSPAPNNLDLDIDDIVNKLL